jgi:hypothetical protein
VPSARRDSLDAAIQAEDIHRRVAVGGGVVA